MIQGDGLLEDPVGHVNRTPDDLHVVHVPYASNVSKGAGPSVDRRFSHKSAKDNSLAGRASFSSHSQCSCH